MGALLDVPTPFLEPAGLGKETQLVMLSFVFSLRLGFGRSSLLGNPWGKFVCFK